MSTITTMRNRQRPWARTVLAAFAIVWLTLALQPCVMAASVGDVVVNDTVHKHGEDLSNSSTEHSNHGSCPHCAVFGGADCEDSTACGDADIVEPRSIVELKDGASKLSAALPTTDSDWRASQRVLDADINPYAKLPPPGPPFTVRYCVYLK